MGHFQDFPALQNDIQKSLVSTVKMANRIGAEDLGFQRTVHPDVAQRLDDASERMLGISSRLLQSAAKACAVKAPRLEDAEDVEMNWRAVVDVLDSVLEKADTAMDEYTGLVKRKDPPKSADRDSKRQRPTGKVIRNANISKPQAQFERRHVAFPKSPWKPILTEKPHAAVSLKESLITIALENAAPQYKHPYEAEITAMEYPPRVFEHADPTPYQPAETTKATWVDTFEGVVEMLDELKRAKEIAVDLEHHDFRTYTGLVCLMQISTRDRDWIVDTLQPWRHKLEILNQVFADPAIIKVFHGAYMDMIWLQRDLGLYVNGLFDTYFACELLYPARSLAFLLSKFANFDADKQYQLADWRMRPIPEEMMYYARSDTHYLLYIYDRVRNDLVAASDRSDPDKDYIGRVLEKSRELSLSRHEHPGYDEESGEGPRGWANYMLKNSHQNFSSEQFAIFRAVWKWRDVTARKEDESPNFVMGTPHVAEIARVNPPDAKALHSLLPQTAPLARARLSEIWDHVQEARKRGGPSLAQFFASIPPEAVRRNGLPRIPKTTLQLPTSDGDLTVTLLPQSRLFGEVPVSTLWEDVPKTEPESSEALIPFPWQQWLQQGSMEGQAAGHETSAGEDASIRWQDKAGRVSVESAEEADAEFTLKKGIKRKTQPVDEYSKSSEEEDVASSGDEEMTEEADGVISIVDRSSARAQNTHRKNEREAEEGRERDKLEARAARKAAKKAKRAREKESMGKEAKFQAVPFNYSTAGSVMHASRAPGVREGEDETGKKGKGNKIFDPYSKTGDDGLKGARKAPPVRGERSATFRK